MNGARTAIATSEVHYPTRGGEPMAETGIHVLVMTAMIQVLRHLFRHRPDVYVIGNIFLFYKEGHSEARRSPDVMVVKGVDPGPERTSFKTWEERAVPSFILEITSRETADEDQGPKRALYQELGVREYFLFDPLGEYLPQPLVGYRLIGEEYEPLPPAADGGLLSAELGVRVVPEGASLGLISFRTGERVPTPPEAYRLLEEVRRRFTDMEQRAVRAEQRAEELTRELARLRAPVASGEGGAGPAKP